MENTTGGGHTGVVLCVASALLNTCTYFHLTPEKISLITALIGWGSGIALALHYLVKTWLMLMLQCEKRRIKRINRRTRKNFERYDAGRGNWFKG